MSSDNCPYTQLESIFRNQKSKAESLTRILEQEREALLTGDVAALETVAQTKLELLEELEALRRREVGWLQDKGIDYYIERRRQAAEELEKVTNLRRAYRAAIDSVAECQSMNTRNGLLLQHRIGYVRRALQALGSIDGNPALYGADGKPESVSQLRCVARG